MDFFHFFGNLSKDAVSLAAAFFVAYLVYESIGQRYELPGVNTLKLKKLKVTAGLITFLITFSLLILLLGLY